MMSADVKGDIYEGLLEKNADDTKSGAGQYFTPRSLIRAMVEYVRPEPMRTIADPACGTGGFFLALYDFIVANQTWKMKICSVSSICYIVKRRAFLNERQAL